MLGPIAFVLPALAQGGAELVFLTLANELAVRGHEVHLVTVSEPGPLADQVIRDVTIVDLAVGQVRRGLWPLIGYLRRERPRVVLATLAHTEVLSVLAARLARTGTPIVVRVASTLTAAQQDNSRSDRRLLAIARMAYPRADLVVTPSRGVEEDLVTFMGGTRLNTRVLYNPIVGPRLRSLAAAEVVHPWFQPGQPPVVLAAGRLTPAKDLPILIRALEILRRTHPARLMILGEGSERPDLEALVVRLGLGDHVAMPGWELNPFRYMARCDAYALSSKREGSPASLIQALACGAPVVSTDCPSGPHEVLAGGRHGTLVPVGDVGALAAGLAAVLDVGRSQPRPEAWEPYTVDNSVDAYERLIAELSPDLTASRRSH